MGEGPQFDRKDFIWRVGTYFILISVFSFAFFLMTDAANAPAFGWLCGSVLLATLGFIFRKRGAKPAPSSGRFSIFKRLGQRAKENRDKAKQK